MKDAFLVNDASLVVVVVVAVASLQKEFRVGHVYARLAEYGPSCLFSFLPSSFKSVWWEKKGSGVRERMDRFDWLFTVVAMQFQDLTVTDDTVLEDHNEDPSLVQMRLIGDGGESVTDTGYKYSGENANISANLFEGHRAVPTIFLSRYF